MKPFVKKYKKEIIVIVVQLLCYYLLPFLAIYISKGTMVLTIFINIINTFILSALISLISKNKLKYLYPIIVAMMYIPSLYIFYDEFVLIYLLLHLVASFIGISIGNLFEIR